MEMFRLFKKKLLFLFILLPLYYAAFASEKKLDSLNFTEQIQSKPNSIDSLKHELDAIFDDSLKASLYTRIASQYLKYDTINDKEQRHTYQNAAIKNTLSAIHFYSRYNDTTGLRISFDMLAKIYHDQHKYSQAKWFILQSNTLSRAQHDKHAIIASLIELSSIKTDVKDYTLAMRDLNEALTMSAKNHYTRQESEVQLHYAMLYTVMKNHEKASLAMKRHTIIDDSIRRDEELKLMAKLNTKDSLQQVKKKLYTINSKKSYKSSSLKKVVLL